MTDTLCIYSEEGNTDFLKTVYDKICHMPNVVGICQDSRDDDFFENLEAGCKNKDQVIFMGHGTSKALYGAAFNPIIDDKCNLDLLKGKQLVLFSCRSAEFLKRYDFHQSLGFGFVPSSLDDARDGNGLHGIPLDDFTSDNIQIIKKYLTNTWIETLDETQTLNPQELYTRLKFNINTGIVNLLISNKKVDKFMTIADILYWIKEDMALC